MSKYFTDFSTETIGALPTGWTTSDCTAVVTADGLALTVSARFAVVFYTPITMSGVTEVYCQFKTDQFNAFHTGLGSTLGEGRLNDTSNINSLYASTTTASANRQTIVEGFTVRSTATITAVPVATNIFNTLLQLDGAVIAGGSYTAKAWFWTEGSTPKTSSDTPDLTYTGTYAHTHPAAPGYGQDSSSASSTLIKFGVGTGGEQAPQTAPSGAISATATLALPPLGFNATANSSANITAAATLALPPLGFNATANSSANITAAATLTLPPLGFAATANSSANITAAATLALPPLGFAATANSSANITAAATLALPPLGFNATANSSANITAAATLALPPLGFAATANSSANITAAATLALPPLGFAATAVTSGKVEAVATLALPPLGFHVDARRPVGYIITVPKTTPFVVVLPKTDPFTVIVR